LTNLSHARGEKTVGIVLMRQSHEVLTSDEPLGFAGQRLCGILQNK
jgi:hypothetical protein